MAAIAWLASLLRGGALQLILMLAALAIFGQSVEQALGRGRYVFLVATAGLVAFLAQLLADGGGALTLACAGAVGAVLGAHLVLHRGARVYTAVFAPLFSTVLAVPAVVVIGLWLALQVPIGLGLDEPLAAMGAGWFAHLAGIVIGLALARLFARSAGSDHGQDEDRTDRSVDRQRAHALAGR